MRRIATVGVIAALGISSAAVAAEGPSHSFVEAGYGLTSVQLLGKNSSANGFGIAGSMELPANIVVTLGYGIRGYDDDLITEFDLTEISLGAGYKWSLSDSVDLTAGVLVKNLKINPDGDTTEDDNGFGLSLGVRGQVTDKLELSSTVKYSSVDFSVIGSKISGFEVSAGGRYYFTPNFAGGLDVISGSMFLGPSEVTFLASVRYSFGKLF